LKALPDWKESDEGYFPMHRQRFIENRSTNSAAASNTKVPAAYWDALKKKDMPRLCEDTGAHMHPPEGLALQVLRDEVVVDIQKREIREAGLDNNLIRDDPLRALLVLLYLLNATPHVIKHQMVSVKDLKDAHFFQGPHELEIAPLLKKFGNNPAGFRRAAEKIGAKPLDLADIAFELMAFPKIPLYYLLWEADPEFQSRISILFDRSIEFHLSADAIWGVVKLVSNALLES